MNQPSHPSFPGNGEMARLCRAFPWASSPLGAPESWPESLRTLVRTVLTAPHPMVLMWGSELTQIYNDAFRPVLGAGPEHPGALGSPAREFWKDIWHLTGEQIEGVLATGESVWEEERCIPIHRNGRLEEVWWSYGYSPCHDAEGRVAGILTVCQELTHRVRAETEIREREALLSMAGAMAHLGGWVVDLETGLCRWSDEVCRIHGTPLGTVVTAEEGIGFYAPEYREPIREAFTRCAREGEPFNMELQILTAGGERVWVRTMGEAIRDRTGDIRVVQGAFQDVSRAKQAAAELEASERRFRELAESMPLIVWTAGPDGEIDYQTRAVREFTGRSAEELEGDGWLEALHPEDREATARAWRTAVATGEPFEVQFRIRDARGEHRWFLTRALPARDEGGAIVRWYGSSTDIHDQLETKQMARATGAALTRTLEAMSDGFLLLDPEWRVVFLNREAERLLDRSAEELLGRNVWERFPEARGSTFEREYTRAVQGNEAVSFMEYFGPLGRWFQVRAFPSDDGLAVYFVDVTSQRAAERRLREQAELLDRARDAILVRELDHRIVYWNAGAERTYGWSAEEAVGRSVRSLLYRDPADFDRATAAVLASGEWTGELEHLRKDGGTVPVEGRWSLIHDDNGAPHRILAIHTDITERQRLLSQFLRAQRLESIGTLAGGIAHDLNNVLAPLLLSVAMLREEIEDPELQDVLETIEAATQRGAALVKQVLAFARGVEGAQVPVALDQVLADLERVIRDTFPRNIEIRMELPEDLHLLRGDPTQVNQVLMNLLVNARDALPEGGTIRIVAENLHVDQQVAALEQAASPGPYVRIWVADDGVGIPPEVVDRIFDPFFTTKEVGRGTGLGLSTVASIMRSHGGVVNVYSEPGRGTMFRLYFPAVTGAHADPGGLAAEPVPRGDGELILVVDDESAVREITRQTLEAFGYRVITASNGADAVARYGERPGEVDLVVTDIMMPVMDGHSAIEALARMDPEVKVVAASGLDAPGSAGRAFGGGALQFLSKPYSAETLLRTVHGLLHGTEE